MAINDLVVASLRSKNGLDGRVWTIENAEKYSMQSDRVSSVTRQISEEIFSLMASLNTEGITGAGICAAPCGTGSLGDLLHSVADDLVELLGRDSLHYVELGPEPVKTSALMGYLLEAGVEPLYARQTLDAKAQVGMWHTDGTSFVLNILLSGPGEYEGGEFVHFEGPIDQFDVDNLGDRLRTSTVKACGDAVYIYGSQVFHGVRPLTSGRRMSLVLSFHCPYSQVDVNKFWHLACDDGVLTTVRPWFRMRRDLAVPAHEQYRRLGIEPITFADLELQG